MRLEFSVSPPTVWNRCSNPMFVQREQCQCLTFGCWVTEGSPFPPDGTVTAATSRCLRAGSALIKKREGCWQGIFTRSSFSALQVLSLLSSMGPWFDNTGSVSQMAHLLCQDEPCDWAGELLPRDPTCFQVQFICQLILILIIARNSSSCEAHSLLRTPDKTEDVPLCCVSLDVGHWKAEQTTDLRVVSNWAEASTRISLHQFSHAQLFLWPESRSSTYYVTFTARPAE